MLQFHLDWKSSASYFHLISCYDEYNEREIDVQHLIGKFRHKLEKVMQDLGFVPEKIDFEEV